MSTLGPRSLHSRSGAGYTQIGCLDSGNPPIIDGGGLVQPGWGTWSLDWWIGADDRWYFPSREASVRQSRSGPGPVVETLMRVPSGDVSHTSFGISTPNGELTVVEIENRSPVPVALAIAVRPYGLNGTTASQEIEVGETEIRVDGRFAVGLPKPANEIATAKSELADLVAAGEALSGTRSVSGKGANSVVLYPLPHSTLLRFVIAGADFKGAFNGEIPNSDAVSRGWAAVIDAGGRIELPEPGASSIASVCRARILDSRSLAERVAKLEPGAGRHLEALALSGAQTEVELMMATFAQRFTRRLRGRPNDAALVISGLGRGAMLISDEELLNPVLESAAQVTSLVEKSGDEAATTVALTGLARLAARLGQSEASDGLWRRVGAGSTSGTPNDVEALAKLAEMASETVSWGQDEVDTAARYWIGLRNQVLREGHTESDPVLELVPEFPTSWRGGNLDVIGLPTDFGPVSFAVRWHGYRPAILWEVEESVLIRCPGLDSSWSTTELKGEALLSGSRDDLPQNPTEGVSFS